MLGEKKAFSRLKDYSVYHSISEAEVVSHSGSAFLKTYVPFVLNMPRRQFLFTLTYQGYILFILCNCH